MSSTIHTTPAFLKALGNLAKENQVSNKEFKAKLAAKANRVKQLQRQRKIADQMDKKLTKLEQKAAKEQAKMDAKQAKEDAKQAKEDAKQAKVQAKEDAKIAKQAKMEAKEDAKIAKQAKMEAKAQVKAEAKAQEKAEEKVQEKKKTKKAIKTVEHNNDRQDIIQILCEKMGHSVHINTETTAISTA